MCQSYRATTKIPGVLKCAALMTNQLSSPVVMKHAAKLDLHLREAHGENAAKHHPIAKSSQQAKAATKEEAAVDGVSKIPGKDFGAERGERERRVRVFTPLLDHSCLAWVWQRKGLVDRPDSREECPGLSKTMFFNYDNSTTRTSTSTASAST